MFFDHFHLLETTNDCLKIPNPRDSAPETETNSSKKLSKSQDYSDVGLSLQDCGPTLVGRRADPLSGIDSRTSR